jgi:acyl-CoA thioester hydrolase
MGIAHHGNYLTWFEVGRTDLCRHVGLEYRRIEELGYLLVVSEINCKYRVPFKYDDEVVIRTTIAQAASRSMKFGYELRDASGEKLHADGFSSHLWLDKQSRKPVVAPKELIAYFAKMI